MIDRKIKMVSILLFGTVAARVMSGLSFVGENGMNEMNLAETIKFVTDIGITPVLLLLFVWLFISRSKDDDNKVKEAYRTAQEHMENSQKSVRDREDYLLAESAKREEIIRQEAERREKLIRQEAERRESILMASQDRMLDTLDSIAASLNKMEGALTKLEVSLSKSEARLDVIERELHNGSNQGNGNKAAQRERY